MKVRYDYQQVFIKLSVEETSEFLSMLDDYTSILESFKDGTLPEDLKKRIQRLNTIVKTTRCAFNKILE